MSIAFYSISLGCPKNRVDSEWLLGVLGEDVTPVEEIQQADLVLINTCGFIAPAIEESVHTIVEAISDIEDAPKKPLLVVAGCLVGRFGKEALAEDLPEVDLWLTNKDLDAWPEMIAQALGVSVVVPPKRLLSTPPSYAYLKISEGCEHNCAFCTIPSIRGKLVSAPSESIVRDARFALDAGVKELVLIAQDVTNYGKDLGERHGLRGLLDKLLPLDGLERLRLMYLYPAGLDMELLQYLRDAGKPFVPYFDIPVQHAHSEVLSRMGRPFARNPMEVISRVRTVFPDAALRSTLIVGFPGETKAHFDELHRFIQDVRFTQLGVFEYQPEEGTPAATMPNQVPDEEKARRRNSIMEEQSLISEEIMEGYLGERLDVLVDEEQGDWDGLYTGRAWFQAPEVDGVCYVSGTGVEAGTMVNAEVIETKTYDLVALA